MKRIYSIMLAALIFVALPSCENEDESGNVEKVEVSGIALTTGTYVGNIENATVNGLATVVEDASVKVQAYDDNSVDITFPKVQIGQVTIDDLQFVEVPVEESVQGTDVWNFEKTSEVDVNGSVINAKISGKLTPKTNQLHVNITISDELGTLIFRGLK